MNRLWAPWRSVYILGKKRKGCFICKSGRSKKDQKNLIIARTRHSFAILNLYPYNSGHVMVVPRRHVRKLSRLSEEAQLDLWRLVNRVVSQIERKMKPDGMNIGLNFERSAGAGLPGHLHVHVVPRWNGDTNFMPVIANTKIISDSLKIVYTNLLLKN
jgi:ATP adenylyltransferase